MYRKVGHAGKKTTSFIRSFKRAINGVALVEVFPKRRG